MKMFSKELDATITPIRRTKRVFCYKNALKIFTKLTVIVYAQIYLLWSAAFPQSIIHIDRGGITADSPFVNSI